MPRFHIQGSMHFVSYNSGVHMVRVGVRFSALPVCPTISVVRPAGSTSGDPTEREVLDAVLSGLARGSPDRKVECAVVENVSWSSLQVVEYVAFLLGDAAIRGEA